MSYDPYRLTEKQRLRIQTRHRASIERFGYQPQALYWSNREIQELRFRKLIEILPSAAALKKQSWSLLDVGCGFADLYNYLQKQDYFPEYCGIDISADMIYAAQSIYPRIRVEAGELSEFEFEDNQFDFVMLSGALNEVVETEVEGNAQYQGEYAKTAIREMYRISQKGVAFNLLDCRNKWVQSRFDLQCFDPLEIIYFCESFASKVELIDGYLDNDFTIYLYKEHF